MNKGRIKELISHPAFISLLLWFLIILIIPPVFTKFIVRHLSDEFCKLNTYFYYYDLDGDGNSELLSVDLNDKVQTKIQVKKGNRVIDQYDLKYQPYSGPFINAADYDNDGCQECYVFTMNNDSIFLNVFEPIKSRKILIANRFVDLRRKAPSSNDAPNIVPLGTVKGLNGKYNDFIFFINTGYSLQPRNLYRYMVKEDTLFKSPVSGEAISGCNIFDLNDDGFSEFLINGLAPGNLDEAFPFSDRFSWIMILDGNLNFFFPPLKLTGNPSRSQMVPIMIDNHFSVIVFNDYFGTGSYESTFSIIDQTGNIIKKIGAGSFENNVASIYPNEENNYRTFYFLQNREKMLEMDHSFKVLKESKVSAITEPHSIMKIDLDKDGRKEYIFQSSDNKQLTVFQHNFKYPVLFESERGPESSFAITSVLKNGSKPKFYIQYGDFGGYYRYEKNNLFFLKYPFYLLLYLSILLFISLLFRIQRYRMNLKLQTEHKIAELQMKSIKNQIDPHFTLNILNAIGSLYATEDNRDRADYIFGKYAKLIRQTVISSDQIIVTLADEIDFIRNYIDLEKFRMNNSFSAEIEIGNDVDMQLKIPRMLVYTFIENGIKYGIRNMKDGGLLKIIARKEEGKLKIIVEDNGPGFTVSGTEHLGTGKGLIILNELIDLYFKLEKTRITYSLQNLSETNAIISGTRAIIEIPVRSSG